MNGEPGFRWVGVRKEHTQAGRPREVRYRGGHSPGVRLKGQSRQECESDNPETGGNAPCLQPFPQQ